MTNKPNQHIPANTIWTAANVITLVRILLVPVLFVAMVSPWPSWFPNWHDADVFKPWLAALLFGVLAATDALDGHLARSRGEITNFGKFMDPLADKILVAAALLALCELQVLPAWVALVILIREFIVSGLRMLAATEGVVVAASWYGKAKTVFQIIAILLFIVKDSHPFVQNPTLEQTLYVISWIFMSIALVLTVVSMLDYLAKCRFLLKLPSSAAPSAADRSGEATGGNAPDTSANLTADASANSSTCTSLPSATDCGGEGTGRPIQEISAGEYSFPEAVLDAASRVIARAETKGATISTAESCTGGLIAGALTAVPGSSAVVEGGVVSYSNTVKHQVLGVSSESLELYGAVSEQVACQMACGSRAALDTTIAVSVTGVAGPGGGSPEKPVGTVWFGVASPQGVHAEVKIFNGNRSDIRLQTVSHALALFEKELQSL